MQYNDDDNNEEVNSESESSSVDETSSESEATEETTQIANPASEYCVAQWGTVNIVKDEEGNESGMCKLADGTEVEEWEYYRANHPETETWATAEEATTQEPATEEAEAWTGEVATTETSDK